MHTDRQFLGIQCQHVGIIQKLREQMKVYHKAK